jgi:YVTN family beta-propeller protein
MLPRLSRRALLLSSAGLWGCGARKATAYPGYCFVANQEGRSLAVVDLSTFRPLRSVPLEAAPAAVLPHPRTPKVFALAPEAGVVFEIDVTSLAVSRRARAGNQAISMRLAPGGDALWVLYREPAALVEFPLDTFEARRRIRLAAPPDDFDLSRDRRAAIAARSTGAVLIASLEHSSIERTVVAGMDPTIVRFQQKGAQIVAGSRSDRSVAMIDVLTGKVVVRLPMPIEPSRFCFSQDEGQLFMTGAGRDAVVIAYPYQTQIGGTFLAGRAPDGMAVVGSNLLVTNPQTNSVTVLDIDTYRLVAIVEVGTEPREILVTPDNQYALVLNEKSGDLAVIRIAALSARDRTRRYKSAPLFTLIPVGAKPVSAAVVTL